MYEPDEYDGDYEEGFAAPPSFELPFEPTNITFTLTKDQGSHIKNLIQNLYDHTFPNYCIRVGIRPPNFYNALNGDRPCTLEFLNKLLSGIGYKADLSNPVLLVQEFETGQVVNAADLVSLENESQLYEKEETLDTLNCSLSEKPLENLKIKQDTLLSEQQEKSSMSSLPSSLTNSNTSLPTQWDVDL